MNKLGFAIIGCGRIAKRHSELLGLGLIQGAKLVAVCDIVQSKAQKIGEQFSVPYFVDMHEMMASVSVDVVVVLTESGNHARDVIGLCRYGKHIIVEKPMALSLADADAMIDAANSAGLMLFVVKQNRFNLPVVKLREAIESGRFGKLFLGTVRVRWCRNQSYYNQDAWRGTWRFDGGVLANQASHHVDLLEWMMGDVESVFAKSVKALADIEAEDTAIAMVKFRNGALGIIEATTATRPKDLEGSISILGEGGTVEIGGFAVNHMKTWSFELPLEGDDEVLSNYSTNPPNVYGFGHHAYYQDVVDCIFGGGGSQNVIDGAMGRKSLELICAIYESIETGLEVRFPFEPTHCKLGISNE